MNTPDFAGNKTPQEIGSLYPTEDSFQKNQLLSQHFKTVFPGADHYLNTSSEVPTLSKSILAKILHIANTGPIVEKDSFYNIKDRILFEHGRMYGFCVQKIEQKCWNCNGEGSTKTREGIVTLCGSCLTSGIYQTFWVLLQRWEVYGYRFLKPIYKTYFEKDKRIAPYLPDLIVGCVSHKKYPRYLSLECCLWLYLFYDCTMFHKTIKSLWVPGWPVYPLSLIGKFFSWTSKNTRKGKSKIKKLFRSINSLTRQKDNNPFEDTLPF